MVNGSSRGRAHEAEREKRRWIRKSPRTLSRFQKLKTAEMLPNKKQETKVKTMVKETARTGPEGQTGFWSDLEQNGATMANSVICRVITCHSLSLHSLFLPSARISPYPVRAAGRTRKSGR
jgi:hypothetical protein